MSFDYIDTKEAARYSHCGVKLIRKACREGALRSVRSGRGYMTTR